MKNFQFFDGQAEMQYCWMEVVGSSLTTPVVGDPMLSIIRLAKDKPKTAEALLRRYFGRKSLRIPEPNDYWWTMEPVHIPVCPDCGQRSNQQYAVCCDVCGLSCNLQEGCGNCDQTPTMTFKHVTSFKFSFNGENDSEVEVWVYDRDFYVQFYYRASPWSPLMSLHSDPEGLDLSTIRKKFPNFFMTEKRQLQRVVHDAVREYNEILNEKPGFIMVKTACGPAIVTWISVPMTWEHQKPETKAPIFWAVPDDKKGETVTVKIDGNASVARYVILTAVRLKYYRRQIEDRLRKDPEETFNLI